MVSALVEPPTGWRGILTEAGIDLENEYVLPSVSVC